ncbi:MAG: hypothetical protein J07HQW2_00802 [Haloquadratum walsbyi J07HQW2]|uniref:Uncharacterized protein n=1 Tax=Haloquadratum walsbyi J07HQW2 TaxID=1238425 RepID=U1NCI0_9EURY|nr:MAG: hypothetical protein J07HQW2_00802 [Haloquadratum walsbyi J07HQW2]
MSLTECPLPNSFPNILKIIRIDAGYNREMVRFVEILVIIMLSIQI